VFSDLGMADDGKIFFRFQEFVPRSSVLNLVEGIDRLQFRYFQRAQPKKGTASSSKTPSGQEKEPLPPGVEVRMHWNAQRPNHEGDFSLVVPVLSGEL
jgi:hypothetical protein